MVIKYTPPHYLATIVRGGKCQTGRSLEVGINVIVHTWIALPKEVFIRPMPDIIFCHDAHAAHVMLYYVDYILLIYRI